MDRETASLFVRKLNEHTQLHDFSAKSLVALSAGVENLAKANKMTSDTVGQQNKLIEAQGARIRSLEKSVNRLLICVGGLVMLFLYLAR